MQDIVKSLCREVLDFRSKRLGDAFSLKSDLARAGLVWPVDAPEAVVIYCSRILDALSAEAVDRLEKAQEERKGREGKDGRRERERNREEKGPRRVPLSAELLKTARSNGALCSAGPLEAGCLKSDLSRAEPGTTRQGTSLFSELLVIERLWLATDAQIAYFHSLRRLGNAVRHLEGKITPADVLLAGAFLSRVIHWFFVRFTYGPGLKTIAREGHAPDWGVSAEFEELLGLLENPVDNRDRLRRLWGAGRPEAPFLATPVLPSLFAELLITKCDAAEEALEVVRAALGTFRGDRRLRQLEALALLKTKERANLKANLKSARRLLNDLRRGSRRDEETDGLLAETLKTIWQRGFSKTDQELHQAASLYLRGWTSSKGRNTHLGINAATLSLVQGKCALSRGIAKKIRESYQWRERKRPGARDVRFVGYGDRATLAEAELLLGRLFAARRLYREAFAVYSLQKGDIEATKRQMELILPRLGLSPCKTAHSNGALVHERRPQKPPLDSPIAGIGLSEGAGPLEAGYLTDDTRRGVEEFLKGETRRAGGTRVTIGVAGHRVLDGPEDLARRVRDALSSLAGQVGDCVRWRVLSSLAEGADRLAARAALERDGTELSAILPLEVDECLRVFETAESRAEFRAFLDRAHEVSVVASHDPLAPSRPADARGETELPRDVLDEAYAAAGRHVVDNCDVLLAIWDGEAARGRGGTAEVVAYARERGRPVVWVRTAGPNKDAHDGHDPVYPCSGRRGTEFEKMDELKELLDKRGGEIMYEPKPIDVANVELPADLVELGEILAEHAHDVWAARRLAEGWKHGPVRDDAKKEHPDLVPYSELPDSEQEYDRETSAGALKAIIAMGFRIVRA